MHVGETDIDERVLTGAHTEQLHLFLAAFVDLFDAVRMDAAVEDELFESEPADFAPYRIEAGEQHRLGGVIDDQIDAGCGFEGADVAAFATDDAALHVVAGQVQDRHDRLGGLFARDPLNRQSDDLAGSGLALVLGVLLDVADDDRGLALGLGLDGLDQLALGVGGSQAGDPLELTGALGLGLGKLRLLPLERLLVLGKFAVAGLDPALLGVETFLALDEPLLAALEVGLVLGDLSLEGAGFVLEG